MICHQVIYDLDTGHTRRCRRRARWYMADRYDRGLCTQHQRSYDIREIEEAS